MASTPCGSCGFTQNAVHWKHCNNCGAFGFSKTAYAVQRANPGSPSISGYQQFKSRRASPVRTTLPEVNGMYQPSPPLKRGLRMQPRKVDKAINSSHNVSKNNRASVANSTGTPDKTKRTQLLDPLSKLTSPPRQSSSQEMASIVSSPSSSSLSPLPSSASSSLPVSSIHLVHSLDSSASSTPKRRGHRTPKADQTPLQMLLSSPISSFSSSPSSIPSSLHSSSSLSSMSHSSSHLSTSNNHIVLRLQEQMKMLLHKVCQQEQVIVEQRHQIQQVVQYINTQPQVYRDHSPQKGDVDGVDNIFTSEVAQESSSPSSSSPSSSSSSSSSPSLAAARAESKREATEKSISSTLASSESMTAPQTTSPVPSDNSNNPNHNNSQEETAQSEESTSSSSYPDNHDISDNQRARTVNDKVDTAKDDGNNNLRVLQEILKASSSASSSLVRSRGNPQDMPLSLPPASSPSSSTTLHYGNHTPPCTYRPPPYVSSARIQKRMKSKKHKPTVPEMIAMMTNDQFLEDVLIPELNQLQNQFYSHLAETETRLWFRINKALDKVDDISITQEQFQHKVRQLLVKTAEEYQHTRARIQAFYVDQKKNTEGIASVQSDLEHFVEETQSAKTASRQLAEARRSKPVYTSKLVATASESLANLERNVHFPTSRRIDSHAKSLPISSSVTAKAINPIVARLFDDLNKRSE